MKALFIYNPNSGRGLKDKEKNYIIKQLEECFENVDSYETKAQLDAYHFLIANGRKYNKIVVSGGDGTLNECVSAIAEQNLDVKIGYIPSGTTNDIARTLRIPKNINKALEVIKNGKIQTYDVMKVNEKYALYVCCFGLFTEVSYTTSQKLKKIFKKLAYVFRLFAIWFKQKAYHLEISTKDKVEKGYFSCLFAVNSRSLSGFKINKNANLSDGKVDLFYIKTKGKKVGIKDKLRLFSCYLKGFNKIKNNKYITKITTDWVSIKNLESGDKINYNLDGEYAFSGDATIKIEKKVKFFVNDKI